MSSLELSLIRGVAEKGQALDKRNHLLRILEGIGTVGAGLIGVAGFGPSYGDAMGVYNGEVLAAYRHIFPDFTINQMNRLSDSAYKSNTLIPKEQAKVIVAFIPQAIFLTPKQRQAFHDDPTSLYPTPTKSTDTVDFRRATALVDGNFVMELENLPVVATGFHIEPEEAAGFLAAHPEVKGYILGQYFEGAQIELVNPIDGMAISLDKQASPEEGKLFFVINSTEPVPSGTILNIKVFNKQNSQTVSQPISYVTPIPSLDAPATSLEGTAGGPDVPISLTGKNLSGITIFGFDPNADSGIEITDIQLGKAANGKSTVTATLKMSKAKPGNYKFGARNGNQLATVDFTVKPKPQQ